MRSTEKLIEKAITLQRDGAPESEVINALRKAYDRGSKYAAFALGQILDGSSSGNSREALVLMKEAADGGIPAACYNLGVSFEHGNHVRKNMKKAAIYYMRGALLGHPRAAFELYRCFYYGIGLERNLDLARAWKRHFVEAGTFEERRNRR